MLSKYYTRKAVNIVESCLSHLYLSHLISLALQGRIVSKPPVLCPHLPPSSPLEGVERRIYCKAKHLGAVTCFSR